MSAAQSHERTETYYRGRVQGVGFRYTTRHIAATYQVTGYVKNLPDGRVLLVAEGQADEIARFHAAIDEQLGGYIVDAHRQTTAATREFGDFDIRF